MQNVALLKLSLYFPALAGMDALKRKAIERAKEQFAFFVNEEGVVVEHSAGYHKFGVGLIRAALRLFTLLETPVPDVLRERYEKALAFRALLRRPDGSLPKIGDTNDGATPPGQKVVEFAGGSAATARTTSRPASARALFLKSGYAVWWSGLDAWPRNEGLSQIAIAWSYYPYMGHKHADEPSINIWAAGRDWWTGVGYWPYTHPKRKQAVSWPGSNAPHLIGEPASSARQSRVLASGTSAGIAFIDLLREGPSGFQVRRQVTHVAPDTWIVLDTFADTSDRRVRTVWTTHPDVMVRPVGDAGRFRMFDPRSRRRMAVHIATSASSAVALEHGSTTPFAGWSASGQTVRPASAIVVEQPSNGSWALMASVLEAAGATGTGAHVTMSEWTGPDGWAMELRRGGRRMLLSRAGGTVLLHRHGNAAGELIALESPSVEAQTDSLNEDAYRRVAAKYGTPFKPFIKYRVRMSFVIAGAAVVNALFLLLCFFRFRERTVVLSATSLLGWGSVGFWLARTYFVA